MGYRSLMTGVPSPERPPGRNVCIKIDVGELNSTNSLESGSRRGAWLEKGSYGSFLTSLQRRDRTQNAGGVKRGNNINKLRRGTYNKTNRGRRLLLREATLHI